MAPTALTQAAPTTTAMASTAVTKATPTTTAMAEATHATTTKM